MTEYPFDRIISNESEVLDYYIDAIRYRNAHKDQSTDIARHVFDRTHPRSRLTFPIGDDIDRLRDEFGALEAPGMPKDDSKDLGEADDELWSRLFDLIEKTKKSRTV